jgi:hypothetical protein
VNLDELEKRVLNPLKAHIPNIDPLHIKVAYEDMMNLAAVTLQFEQAGNMSKFIEIVEAGNKDKATLIYWKNRCSYSLLKAVYAFADVFINVSLQKTYNKVFKKPSSTWPLKEFCKLVLQLGMDKEIVRNVWCIKKYRNMMIIHWDIDRIHSYHSDASGEIRLSPIPKDFKIGTKDSLKIGSMYAKYKPLYPELPDSENYYERLRGLYYRIPLIERNGVNPDRRSIDQIAEKGGCDSMTIPEIVEAIQSFIIGLSNAVVKCRGNFA